MNTLEDRVRSAMRATAAEIGPDEVPPLGPRGGQYTISAPGDASGPVGVRRSGSRRWARWGVPLTAAAAVLAVVAAGLGTGVITGGGPRPDGAGPVTGPTPGRTATPGGGTVAPAGGNAPGGAPPYGSTARLTSGLVSLYLTASGAQFTAGQRFAATYGAMENAIVLRCLAGRGFRLPAGTYVAGKGGGWDLVQFPDLASIARAGALPGDDGATVTGPPATIRSSDAYARALMACLQPEHDPFTAMENYGWALGGAFADMVTAIQASAPVRATIPALRACAARYGWPRDSQGNNRPLNSFGDFVTWMTTFLDGPLSQGASAATMAGLDRQWGPRFVECARPTVSVMEKLQLAAQRIYLTAYGRQLARLVDLAKHAFSVAQAASR